MPCIKKDIRNCSICEFDILTKETLFKMINETNRLKALYKESQNILERNKLKQSAILITNKLNEMLCVYKETYGEKDFKTLSKIIKELIDEKD